MPRANRFTIYDMMEQKGKFASNPANPGATDSEGLPLYKGPVAYPKMFYHPQGAERVLNPGELVSTLEGPKLRGRQTEIEWRIVGNAEDEAALRAAGWHDNPRDAMIAAGKEPPPESPMDEITRLRKQVEQLSAEKAALEKELA
jgi:hypothetical protein